MDIPKVLLCYHVKWWNSFPFIYCFWFKVYQRVAGFWDKTDIKNIFSISDFFLCIAAEFMQLTYDYIHLKADSNSKLNGYWTSDIGGLNEVTHIWEYGNFS